MIKVFEKMRRDIKDSSIVIISHQERILNIADEIIVLADGKLVDRGSKDEIMPTLIGANAPAKQCNKADPEKGDE